MKTCTIGDCSKRHVARGLCGAHYQAAVKAGTLNRHQTTAPAPSDDCLWCRTPIENPGPYKRYCDEVCCKRAASHKEVCTLWPDCIHDRPRIGKARLPLLERLLRNVDQSGGENACWLWTGTVNERGYGQTYIDRGDKRVTTGAHRAMHIALNGDIDDGLFVLHGCNNPPCCNPRHLRTGTQVENMADRQRHGAGYPRGEEHFGAVHVNEDVITAIRELYRPRMKGRGQHALAQQFGLSRSTVQRIVTESDRWTAAA